MATSLRTVMLDIRRGARGRPKAPWESMADLVSFAYLVGISKKYETETAKFLKCVHGAWIKGESCCDDISISRRQKTEVSATLLVIQEEKIIGQVRLSSRVLSHLARPETLDLRFDAYHASKCVASVQTEDVEIKDLNSKTKRFNLNAKVTEKSSPRTTLSRSGYTLLLCTATIRDRSGAIKLSLWNDQIGMVSTGDLVRIENARVKRFRGELHVRLDRLAKLRVVDSRQNK